MFGRAVGGEHQFAGTGIGFEEERFARVVALDEFLVQALAGPEIAAVQVEGVEGVDRGTAVVGVGQLFTGIDKGAVGIVDDLVVARFPVGEPQGVASFQTVGRLNPQLGLPVGIVLAVDEVLPADGSKGGQVVALQVGDGIVEQGEYVLVNRLLTVELRLVDDPRLQRFAPRNVTHEVGEGSQVECREHLSHAQQVVGARLDSAGSAAFAYDFQGTQVAVGAAPGVVEGGRRVDVGESHLGVVHLVEDARLLFHVDRRVEGKVARHEVDGRGGLGIGEEVARRYLFGVVLVAVEAIHHIVGTGGEQPGRAEDIYPLFHIHEMFEG